MARATLSFLLVAFLAGTALADRIVLADGRTFTGTVKVADGVVRIEMAYGTFEFPRSKVTRIELGDTPETELAKKLVDVSEDDAAGMAAVAQWAEQNDLPRQARELYLQVLEVEPSNEIARQALGYVHIDDKWLPFDKALQLARSKLEGGHHARMSETVLPALRAAADTEARIVAVRELGALNDLRGGKFAEARRTFQSLAESQKGPRAFRYETLSGILKENPNGLYVLTEAYPPTAGLLDSKQVSLKAGPASLTNPDVVRAALRDEAKKQIQAGRKLMDAARDADKKDEHDAAKAKYYQAEQAFDRADTLVENISRSYRVEIVRRRIASIRRDVESNSSRFDEEMVKLGQKNLSNNEYKTLVARLIRRLDRVRDDLNRIIEVSEPYPRDLVLEVKWAELDLKKIEAMREVLHSELHGKS
ncbi:MAG: hypothetical protein ACLFVU_05660 [Phycisphaerae bacterium]